MLSKPNGIYRRKVIPQALPGITTIVGEKDVAGGRAERELVAVQVQGMTKHDVVAIGLG